MEFEDIIVDYSQELSLLYYEMFDSDYLITIDISTALHAHAVLGALTLGVKVKGVRENQHVKQR